MNRSDLKRWLADPVAFAREACVLRRPDDTTGPPLLSSRQEQVLRQLARPDLRQVAIIWPKRSGKTLLAALALLWASLSPDRHSVVLSNSERQASALSWSMARDLTECSPLLAREASIREGLISFGWGSDIMVVPCNRRTVTGIGVTGLLHSDELWAALDPEVFFLLAAQSERGKVLVTSQASGLDSHVYKLWRSHEEGSADPSLAVDYLRFASLEGAVAEYPNPYMTRDFLRAQQAQLPEALFKSYFLGEWAEVNAAFLSEELLQSCVVDDYALPLSPPEWAKWRQRGAVLCAGGLDRALGNVGGGSDQTVWALMARVDPLPPPEPPWPPYLRMGSVFNEFKPEYHEWKRLHTAWEATVAGGGGDLGHYYLVDLQVCGSSDDQQLRDLMIASGRRFGPLSDTTLEVYQSADLFRSLVREPAHSLGNVQLESAGASSQWVAFSALHSVMSDGRFHVPRQGGELLVRELRGLQLDASRNPPRVGHAPGGHDDAVYATLWAFDRLRQRGPAPPPARVRARIA